MREPLSRRRSASLALIRSTPSKTIPPLTIRQPGRANPMAASPSVDLPAPDSPMSPRTSPRCSVKSTPLTISCQRSSLYPSIQRSLISRRVFPFSRTLFAPALLFIAQSACLVQEPVHHEIDCHRQKRDGSGREQGSELSVVDQGGILLHHRPPVGGRRLDAEAQERKRADLEENEAEPQTKFSDQCG